MINRTEGKAGGSEREPAFYGEIVRRDDVLRVADQVKRFASVRGIDERLGSHLGHAVEEVSELFFSANHEADSKDAKTVVQLEREGRFWCFCIRNNLPLVELMTGYYRKRDELLFTLILVGLADEMKLEGSGEAVSLRLVFPGGGR